jgi:hypothetical protein
MDFSYGAYSRSLALKETKTIEWHGGGGAGEVGEFIGELLARHALTLSFWDNLFPGK